MATTPVVFVKVYCKLHFCGGCLKLENIMYRQNSEARTSVISVVHNPGENFVKRLLIIYILYIHVFKIINTFYVNSLVLYCSVQ